MKQNSCFVSYDFFMTSVETDHLTGVTRIHLHIHTDRDLRKALGQALRQERTARKWTLRDLAQKVADVTEQYVGMVERGDRRPSLDVLVRILEALELGPEVEQDGTAVTFWCSDMTEHVTVHLAPRSSLRGIEAPEWKARQEAEDAARLGQIAFVLTRSRDRLLDVHRFLGLDPSWNAYEAEQERSYEQWND